MSGIAEKFEAMLAGGEDSALLRFSLGNAYLADDPERAAGHFRRATELDPGYSAAWKLLGRALASCGRPGEARAAYVTGIETAQARGDVQAAKEMRVFLRRLEKK